MSEFIALFHNPFPTFMSGLFWADFLTVCLLALLFYMIIHRQSKSILSRNIAYNKGLFKFRTEVYLNYEKNFFT